MIDVTFLLLIFFMCTLKFKTLEGTIGANLPKDVGVTIRTAEPLEKAVVRLDVANPGTKLVQLADGSSRPLTAEDAQQPRRFTYGEDRVLRYRVGPRGDLTRAETIEVLRSLQQKNAETRFTVDPREGVTQDDVVQLLDAMLGIGITDVSFSGSYER